MSNSLNLCGFSGLEGATLEIGVTSVLTDVWGMIWQKVGIPQPQGVFKSWIPKYERLIEVKYNFRPEAWIRSSGWLL